MCISPSMGRVRAGLTKDTLGPVILSSIFSEVRNAHLGLQIVSIVENWTQNYSPLYLLYLGGGIYH